MLDTNLDLLVLSHLVRIVLVVLVGVHLQVVESKLLLYPLLESRTLLQGQAVTLRNDGNDIDEFRQLLQHDNVDGLEGVTRGLDEEEAAVNAGVLQVTLALSGQLLAEVCTVLVLDVLDNGIPASVVVDEVAVAGSIDDVQAKSHAVFLDDMGDRLDLSGGTDWVVGGHATLGVHEMRRKDGVDQCGFPETGLTCLHQSLPNGSQTLQGLNVPTQMTLNWKPRLSSLRSI